jgi:hypothetical protein
MEILGYVAEQEKAIESKNESLVAQKANIQNKLLDVDKKITNLIGAIEKIGISAEISSALDERRKEKQVLLEQLNEINGNLANAKTKLLEIVSAYKKDMLQAFLGGDGATKRVIYLNTLKSARVEEGRLIVVYSNGKEFRITLGKGNKSIYLIDIYFGKMFQIAVDFDSATSKWTYNRERFNALFNSPILVGYDRKTVMEIEFQAYRLITDNGDHGEAIKVIVERLLRDHIQGKKTTFRFNVEGSYLDKSPPEQARSPQTKQIEKER